MLRRCTGLLAFAAAHSVTTFAAIALPTIIMPSTVAAVSLEIKGDSASPSALETLTVREKTLRPEVPGDAFDAFVAKYGRSYQRGSIEYATRRSIFLRRQAEVDAQNAKHARQSSLWHAAVGRYADWTDSERKSLCGWVNMRDSGREDGTGKTSSLVTLGVTLPNTFDWMNLTSARSSKDQGTCGSCWAIATASVLETHYEIHVGSPAKLRSFSTQEVISCTPNPQECGGKGGCKGATVELGLNWVLQHGCSTMAEVPYKAKDSPCTKKANSLVTGASFGMRGYHMLPRNLEQPLAEALVKHGPVAISVSAGAWFEYLGGIFDSCAKDCVVDHAVTLFGYSAQGTTKYWLIRNSWGESWGEKGFIRVLRHGVEGAHCGIDTDPGEGTACKGGPKTVKVCGMCGMLYDSVIPSFTSARSATSPGKVGAGGKQPTPADFPLRGPPPEPKPVLMDDGDTNAANASTMSPASAIVGSDAVPRLVRQEMRRGVDAGDQAEFVPKRVSFTGVVQ